MSLDPTHTDPDKYAVIFENERIRVLEYKEPGPAGDGAALGPSSRT
jgi:hypothetical protein